MAREYGRCKTGEPNYKFKMAKFGKRNSLPENIQQN